MRAPSDRSDAQRREIRPGWSRPTCHAGPATTFWNPANTASGDYTIKATFLEPKFMELNNHPHSYGIFIGGSTTGTDTKSRVFFAAGGGRAPVLLGFPPAGVSMLGGGAASSG